MYASKLAMDFLPNIHLIGVFIIALTDVYGKKALYPIYVYVLLEFLLNGVNLWAINYLYVWLILAAGAWLLREMTSPLGWALLSGVFGLLFGALCAPVYLVVGGPAYALSWWISGIPFDLLHCAGNFVITLVLFVPLRRLTKQLYQKTVDNKI